MSRRLLTNLATIIPALFLAACNAPVEEEVVAEPIHIISSFGEAGSSAKTIRILAPKIEAHFQRPVEIHYNEGGKGGDIGARMAANAPADQTTLFVGTVGNIALLPNVLSSYEINPAEDFRAVTHLTATPDVLIANSGLGVSTLDELVAYAMEKGEPLSYSHIAPLSIHRMEFVEILNELGIEAINDESIRGSARAMEAVANGSIDLAMTTAPYVAPMVADGSVVPLAVAHETRLPVYPDVPTMVESGIAIEHGSWSGAFVPAAASAEEAQQMFEALETALNDAEVIAQLAELGMIAAPSASPEAFANYITEETARLGALAEAHNIREE
jgi:tripartite-type tricarboxylate transporter receptor subunit TctC